MTEHYDSTARNVDLPPLFAGQHVRILNKERKRWCTGTIVEKCSEPRSYVVETPNGNRLRRNRNHLREMMIPKFTKTDADLMPDTNPTDPEIPEQNVVNYNKQSQSDDAMPQQRAVPMNNGPRRSGHAIKTPERYRD